MYVLLLNPKIINFVSNAISWMSYIAIVVSILCSVFAATLDMETRNLKNNYAWCHACIANPSILGVFCSYL